MRVKKRQGGVCALNLAAVTCDSHVWNLKGGGVERRGVHVEFSQVSVIVS